MDVKHTKTYTHEIILNLEREKILRSQIKIEIMRRIAGVQFDLIEISSLLVMLNLERERFQIRLRKWEYYLTLLRSLIVILKSLSSKQRN